MISMRARRLQVEPAGIEAHAFADQRHLGVCRIAPTDIDQARARAARPCRPRESAENSGRGSSSPTMQAKLAPRRLASASAAMRQFLRSHVVGRRVDEVARQRRCFRHPGDVGGIDAVGRHQPDVGRIRLAVTAEAVAAERKGKRRPDGCHAAHWRSDRCPAAAGRAARRAGTGRAELRASSSSPNSTCAIWPSAAGRIRHLPGLAVKPLASANCRAGAEARRGSRPRSPWSQR